MKWVFFYKGDHLSVFLLMSKKTKNFFFSYYEVKGALLLNVVVSKFLAVFELLPCKNKTLLVGWDTFLVLNFGLDILNRGNRFHIQCDGLSSESLHENLHFR